ncbi:MAG: DUF1508 domain-containing protein [Actinomycetota bacterium]
MAGKGELYQQKNGKWAFRVKASNGQIVAQSQGYTKRASARSTLEKLLNGTYDGPIVEPGK